MSAAEANAFCVNTLLTALGITFVDVGPDYLSATMPVDERTLQPFGILHGGASVALAESLGSMASAMVIRNEEEELLGIEINANHVRAVRDGTVKGTVRPIHIGATLHLWEIRIVDERDRLTCIARLTVLIRQRRARPT